MKIENNESLLFIGDSITDCGRARPVGKGNELGDGYVSIVNSLLAAWYPRLCIKVLNTGNSGDRIIDLEARWQEDVLALAPHWLSVMIGINDVWRQFDYPSGLEQVNIELYRKTYHKLLSQTRPKLKGLVLMSPYYLEANPGDPMRKLMDTYGEVVKETAKEFDALYVDVQAAFNFYLSHKPTQSLCGDRVHPNKTGHMIIAASFMKAVGLDWTLADKQY